VTWAVIAVELPIASSVEIFAEDQRLRLEIDVHANAATLTVLADALRKAVLDVDAERADLEARRGS
jgi:hypothetical protein